MAHRRNLKLGSSKSKKKKKKKRSKSKRERVKEPNLLDLPYDLLQLIMSRLPSKDNIRASAVCKTWHQASLSVRVAAEKSPWLIYFTETDGSFELYDPSIKKTYNLEFPELSDFRVCYSKDGWLLMYNPNSYQLLFFNPFTGDSILVPSRWMAYDQQMAFSCAPTSSACLLFTVSNVSLNHITIQTSRPNATRWETFVFRSRLSRNHNNFEQIVFSNGVFYCLTNTGCLSIFEPASNSWNVLPGRPPKGSGSNGCFMTEHKGEIFLIYMYTYMYPTVLKLNRTNYEWTKRKTLGGLTIYASALSSEVRAEQESGVRNCLCLSVFHGFKRMCLYYKFGEESRTCFKWKNHGLYKHIWIMPPLNLPFV